MLVCHQSTFLTFNVGRLDMEAVVAVALLFLPAIIYFVRSPHRASNADVLGSLLGIWLGLTILIYLEPLAKVGRIFLTAPQ